MSAILWLVYQYSFYPPVSHYVYLPSMIIHHIHTHIHTHARKHIRTYTHSPKPTYTHADIHTHTHLYTHARTYTHAHAPTRTQTHKQTHTHPPVFRVLHRPSSSFRTRFSNIFLRYDICRWKRR